MKKQQKKAKPDQVRVTLRMDREVWSDARHAALDRGIPFGRLVSDALRVYLGVKS
jgi:hypothetical protein